MKSSISALVAIAILASPAGAASPDAVQVISDSQPPLVPAKLADPETLRLARQFVDQMYPNALQDSIKDMKERSYSNIDEIEQVSLRNNLRAQLEPVLVKATATFNRHVPIVMEAYSQAYASEFSQEELRQMIAFGATPAGRHFLDKADFANNSEGVYAANADMHDALTPLFEDLTKEMCQQRTKMLIAAGDKKAKCNLG